MPSGHPHATQMNVGVLSARELAAERRLIEASQRDRNRFGQLYERYFHRVYAFAITRTGDRTAAEDATAGTFHRPPPPPPPPARQGPRQTPLDDLREDESEPWETRLIEVEQRTRLIELVNRLPKDQRRGLYMRLVYPGSNRRGGPAG